MTQQSETGSDLLWNERFRPETLSEIKGNQQVVKRLQNWVGDPSTPHALLSGPPGTGKTSVVLAYAKETYGDEWRQNVLSLNASDERGIDVVRDKIKKFARRSTALGSNVDYKIILLDESDSLTSSAQAALRRIMEDYSDQTKFFLTCNWQSQIIPAIQSRCVPLRMEPLDYQTVCKVLEGVCEKVEVDCDGEALETIANASDGDMRRAIGNLQASVDPDTGKITQESVESIMSVVDTESLEEIIELCVKGEYKTAFGRFDKEFMKERVDSQMICSELADIIVESDYEYSAKYKMLEVLSEGDWRIYNGCNPAVQWHGILSGIAMARYLTLDAYEEYQ